MKSAVKTKAKNTNNQASLGMSLLKHNQNVEAAIELSRHLDETGVGLVWTGLAAFLFVWNMFGFWTKPMCHVCTVLSQFLRCLVFVCFRPRRLSGTIFLV